MSKQVNVLVGVRQPTFIAPKQQFESYTTMEHAVIVNDGSGVALLEGTREDLTGLGKRLVKWFGRKTSDAAVAFDQEAFRAWLNAPTDDGGTNRAANPYLDTAYDPTDATAGGMLASTLDMLRSQPQVWSYDDGVSDVRVWTTSDAEGTDGGVTAEVTIDGLVLSLGHLPAGTLVRNYTPNTPLPGIEAAEQALRALAFAVNVTASHVRWMDAANADS